MDLGLRPPQRKIWSLASHFLATVQSTPMKLEAQCAALRLPPKKKIHKHNKDTAERNLKCQFLCKGKAYYRSYSLRGCQ